jgi:NADH-quinone oxidoreductase subunit E
VADVDLGLPASTTVPAGVPPLTEQTRAEAREIIARYPRSRSALLPMLHLVQSVQGYVSPQGIALCAEELDLTKAEVGAVATFYSMYRRTPAGTYHVGVCTNTLCAVLGGDAIFASLKEHLGIGHNQTLEDGTVSLEHIECNAACDYAPVVMVNWEFYDDQTPGTARELVDSLRAGTPLPPTRGPKSLPTFKETSRVLAGFNDGRGQEGIAAGPASLVGLEIARRRGDKAPAYPGAATDGQEG